MSLNPIVLSIPIYFTLIGVELLVERLQHTEKYRFHDAITNISCGMTSQISGVLLKVGVIGVYELLYEHARLFNVPRTWATGILLFVLADLCYYFAHRYSHEINFMWGGHVVHHQSEDYNLSVALRQSSLQGLFTFLFYLPLAVLGFETSWFVYTSALVTLYQFWIHTEFIGKLGPLEWVLNTPSHHRVHHGRNPKYIDKNYAGTFIVWDRLFGTFQEEEETPVYGITTPVHSWNPVWVNFGHYFQMREQLRQTPGLGNKLRVVFGRPGWRPAALGGPYQVPEVEPGSYQKYTTSAPRTVNFYVLVQYAALLGVAAVFLFTQKNMEPLLRWLVAGWCVWAALACGALFEAKRLGYWLEPLRLLASLALLLYGLRTSPQLNVAAASGLVWAAGSALWWFSFRQAFTKVQAQKTPAYA
ncbi:sterol desaturase family protein [Hymenobacter busanensis]|uniref:Sterol desaturase family protein n=1 Tax=Hymenobacter busanensis TaxID=2607656 RepID=A0A7L5A3S6_9BACT|nr:sterol desaturase family protein [Hymenobacter busanensis]KAA9331446.1 sterol desaturase family protein [Hymenobacter busanensis]QHJ08600.1 sterol desaturase family protein [Hymenobacter busanensis]